MPVKPRGVKVCPVLLSAVLAGLLPAGCGGGGGNEPAADSAAGQQARAATAVPPAAGRASVQQVKACTLFTRAEIEKATGRTVLEPAEAGAAELSTCSYGDPDSPKLAGRSLSNIVEMSVFSGGNGYHAGPVAQANDAFEIALRNAGEVTPVTGLGDKAHWAGKTLRILRGAYLIEIEVDAGDGSRQVAERLAATAVGRLR
jgi:hypothetical protein